LIIVEAVVILFITAVLEPSADATARPLRTASASTPLSSTIRCIGADARDEARPLKLS